MKRTQILLSLIFVFAAMLCGGKAHAQTVIPEGYELVDSLVYRPVAAVDTTLAGRNIFDLLPAPGSDADVDVRQSQLINGSMAAHIESNASRTMSGYRVRIFFDNRQSARKESENVLKRFHSIFPDVMAYRLYANPYFKVTVGDFRTRSEAMALLARIKGDFPSAFVVKENIEYPAVDSRNAVVIDTLKVLRPKNQMVKE